MPIKLLVLDIDGVITDGTVLLLESGDEPRRVHFHDLDAVSEARRLGFQVAIVSGENTPSSRRVATRFAIDEAVFGAKDKLGALKTLAERLGVPLDETCYVGDSPRDVPAMRAVGISLAPADATPQARAAADRVLHTRGGRGAVAEAVAFLIEMLGLTNERNEG